MLTLRTVVVLLAVSLLSACWQDESDPAIDANGGAVIAGNRAPTISGSPPATVAAGEVLAFKPTAADPEGAPLTFTVANLPFWASFDPFDGSIRGTPTAAQAGTYANITLTVSDGARSASLGPFSITVTVATASALTGTASLSWAAPTMRVDGSPLIGLAGYKVHVGRAPRNYSRVEDIGGAANTRYTVTGLGSGTWYFSISAYDSMGLESDKTADVSKSF